MEAVKAGILKLLDVGVIYPITDSKWVAPIHVVPKKTRITLIKNKNNELIPTRISSGWRMYYMQRSFLITIHEPNA